jgi:hypothetical protein
VLNSLYLANLESYFKSCETTAVPFFVLAILHLADGVTITLDSMGEFDIYFDRERWEPEELEIWNQSEYSGELHKRNLGVLPGAGFFHLHHLSKS